MLTQMRAYTFEIFVLISVINSQSTYNLACDTNQIHKKSTTWLFHLFMRRPPAAELNVLLCLKPNSSLNKLRANKEMLSTSRNCWSIYKSTPPMKYSPRTLSHFLVTLRLWLYRHRIMRKSMQLSRSDAERFTINATWKKFRQCSQTSPAYQTIVLQYDPRVILVRPH